MTQAWAIVDLVIVILVIASMARGYLKGLVSEGVSLVTWACAIWVSFRFTAILAAQFAHLIQSPTMRYWVICAILFGVVLIAGNLANALIGKFLHKVGLSGTDRVLGVVFGFARGLLIVAFLVALGSQATFSEKSWWKGSMLIPRVKPASDWIQNLMKDPSVQQKTASLQHWLTADVGLMKVDNS